MVSSIHTHWWNGEVYSINSSSQTFLAQSILPDIPITHSSKVLDIGCGDGQITYQIALKAANGRVVGLDASSSMIQKCREKQLNHLHYINDQAETFSLTEEFDLIVSFSAFHWMKDQKAVWNNVRKHLKVGGKAYIHLNPGPRNESLTQALNEIYPFKEDHIMPIYSLSDYRQMVESVGLKVTECSASFPSFEFESNEAFKNNLRGWLPHLSVIPEKEHSLFLDKVVNRYLELTRQTIPIKLPYNHFKVIAERI